ncbi:MAG: hypothetical protein WKF40_05935 [Thermoleophilaceae bacterium]
MDVPLAGHQFHDRRVSAAPRYKPILATAGHRQACRRLVERRRSATLAEAEQRYAEILSNANAAAQMIEEARESAGHVAERKQQEAIVAAEQIVAKARRQADPKS